jgi:hypothetical protein
MIYYYLSGYELEENYETYLPWIEGIREHFTLKFSKEQSIERLKLIFIDLYKAKHEFSKTEYIELDNLIKSDSPIIQVEIE